MVTAAIIQPKDRKAGGAQADARLFGASIWLGIALALFFAICPLGTLPTRFAGSAFSPTNAEVALQSRPQRDRGVERAAQKPDDDARAGASDGGSLFGHLALLPLTLAVAAPSILFVPVRSGARWPSLSPLALSAQRTARGPPSPAQ